MNYLAHPELNSEVTTLAHCAWFVLHKENAAV